jgi:putative transcriptional regulator
MCGVHSEVGRGSFLIAHPTLRDPNFSRTVVLLCEHDAEEGSMGLVVNRPTEVRLGDTLEGLDETDPQPLYCGGPVQRDIVVVLHHGAAVPGAHLVCDGMALGGEAESILALLRGAPRARVRVFSGYSGWGAGQLQGELEAGSWIICPASARLVFESDPASLWADVLRSLGPRYEILTRVPLDPRVN